MWRASATVAAGAYTATFLKDLTTSQTGTAGACSSVEPIPSIVFFDEDENTTTVTTIPLPSPLPPPSASINIPRETQRISPSTFPRPSGAVAGWASLEFRNLATGTVLDQAWVSYDFMGAAAFLSAAAPATQLDPSTCNPLGVPIAAFSTGVNGPVAPVIPGGITGGSGPAVRLESVRLRTARCNFGFHGGRDESPAHFFSWSSSRFRFRTGASKSINRPFFKCSSPTLERICNRANYRIEKLDACPFPGGLPLVILKTRRSVLALLTVVACAAIFVAPRDAAAVDCGNRGSQDQQAHPPYSGTLPNLLSTANGDKYIYTATEWGFARAPLTNPASPGPLQLIQIGQKFVPGDNGGLIYLGCDCYQGASTMDAAEAPDGSSRMISDWVATYANVLKGMVATTTGASSPAFGDQIEINQVALGSTVAAIYHPASGRYFGYFPSNNGLQIVDLTNPNGSTQPSLALRPTGTFPWAGVGVLKAGIVSIGGLPRVMLAGYIGPSQTLRVAEVGSDGTPVEKASIASGGSNALYIANVNGKVYVFSADYAAGLNVYEYTGSALTFAGNLPGYINNVVVKGNPGGNFPAIFLHRSIKPSASRGATRRIRRMASTSSTRNGS